MRILVVCKANFEISEVEFEKKRSYIYDQVKCLRDAGLIVNVFFLKGRGVYSYFRGALELRKYLENNQFDVVHGHYGFTGFVVGLVSKNPIVVTYHGTDIYEKIGGVISFFSIRWAEWNIFVSKRLYERALFKPRRNFSIFPCGVDLDVFFPVEKKIACEKLGLDPQAKRILFSSSFNNPIKNYPLALEAIELSGVRPIEFLELKNKTREEVALLLNASDLVLITSHFEGSSQIAKEALACNCPIVSTDVGEVKKFIGSSSHSFITSNNPVEIGEKIKLIFSSNKRSNGRNYTKDLSNKVISKKLIEIYHKLNHN